jgi:hypothetical protein
MRWHYCLLVVGALALMGGNCTEGGVVPCVEDADCVDTCTSDCDRRGEELLSWACAANTACQCGCSSSGTGGADGGEAGGGGSGGAGGGEAGVGGSGGSS